MKFLSTGFDLSPGRIKMSTTTDLNAKVPPTYKAENNSGLCRIDKKVDFS